MTDKHDDPASLGRMAQHFEALEDPWRDLGTRLRVAAALMLAAAFVAGLLIGGAAALWWRA